MSPTPLVTFFVAPTISPVSIVLVEGFKTSGIRVQVLFTVECSLFALKALVFISFQKNLPYLCSFKIHLGPVVDCFASLTYSPK